MKLTFEQIKSVTVGAVRIWQENTTVRFSKCTQKQVDAWYKLDTVLGERAEATTGVRLDFHTNSSSFAFTASSGSKFEIHINGLLTHFITDSHGSIALDTSKGENRITLILPSHETGALSSVELDDGATLTAHKFDRKLLFIGDSITQGWNSGYDSLSYAYRVSHNLNAYSVIHGVGGGFFDESTLDDELDYDPDIVIVAFGTNDWGRDTLEGLAEKFGSFFDKLLKKYSGKTVFAISPIWRADTYRRKGGTDFDDLCLTVKNAALERGIIVVDGKNMVPPLTQFFSDEYLHPNALGFSIYAENLTKFIQKHI